VLSYFLYTQYLSSSHTGAGAKVCTSEMASNRGNCDECPKKFIFYKVLYFLKSSSVISRFVLCARCVRDARFFHIFLVSPGFNFTKRTLRAFHSLRPIFFSQRQPSRLVIRLLIFFG